MTFVDVQRSLAVRNQFPTTLRVLVALERDLKAWKQEAARRSLTALPRPYPDFATPLLESKGSHLYYSFYAIILNFN